MSKRRKRRSSDLSIEPPALTGVARLLSESPLATLDLHGCTRTQAPSRVRDFLITHSRVSRGSVVQVITGRGRGSEGVPVLLGVVRDMLEGEVGDLVEEYAGMPGGGGWVVRVR